MSETSIDQIKAELGRLGWSPEETHTRSPAGEKFRVYARKGQQRVIVMAKTCVDACHEALKLARRHDPVRTVLRFKKPGDKSDETLRSVLVTLELNAQKNWRATR